MDYKEMIDALSLDKYTETLLRIKDKILPEVWEQIERYTEIGGEHENTSI